MPFLILTFAVLIALGLGVLAAEDWDGFAGRINQGKTLAFYASIALGLLWILRGQKNARQSPLHTAQIIGLGLALIAWPALL